MLERDPALRLSHLYRESCYDANTTKNDVKSAYLSGWAIKQITDLEHVGANDWVLLQIDAGLDADADKRRIVVFKKALGVCIPILDARHTR